MGLQPFLHLIYKVCQIFNDIQGFSANTEGNSQPIKVFIVKPGL